MGERLSGVSVLISDGSKIMLSLNCFHESSIQNVLRVTEPGSRSTIFFLGEDITLLTLKIRRGGVIISSQFSVNDLFCTQLEDILYLSRYFSLLYSVHPLIHSRWCC